MRQRALTFSVSRSGQSLPDKGVGGECEGRLWQLNHWGGALCNSFCHGHFAGVVCDSGLNSCRSILLACESVMIWGSCYVAIEKREVLWISRKTEMIQGNKTSR